MENKTAPPPRNGSQYVEIRLGSNGVISSNNCRLPPTHFNTGVTSLFSDISAIPFTEQSVKALFSFAHGQRKTACRFPLPMGKGKRHAVFLYYIIFDSRKQAVLERISCPALSTSALWITCGIPYRSVQVSPISLRGKACASGLFRAALLCFFSSFPNVQRPLISVLIAEKIFFGRFFDRERDKRPLLIVFLV